MTKRLLGIGDSFTDPDYKCKITNTKIGPTWPVLLADSLDGDWSATNVGKGGAGNDWMVTSFFKNISLHGKPDLVCILWSKSSRLTMAANDDYSHWTIDPIAINHSYENNFKSHVPEYVNAFAKEYYCNHYHSGGYFKRMIDTYMTNVYIIQQYCQSNNIPYAFGQAIDMISHEFSDKANLMRQIIDHPIESMIDDKKFFGWPAYRELGGYTIADHINKNVEYAMHDEDRHPNELGHYFISNKFLNVIKDSYNEITN